MTRTRPPEPILHVDMDAFYASVEVLKDPSLRGKPVVVGGAGPRGVVMSASYESRRYGIRSAMPSARAKRLCPEAVFVRPDFTSYQAYSTRLREVLLSFTPHVEPISLDEAFLDVGGSTSLFGPPREIAEAIRARVRDELALVCSVGVAPNKFLAKLASTTAKPDGLLVVEPAEIESFLHPLPVTALWGVGEQTAEVLRRLGLKTVADIAAVSERTLQRAVGDALGAHLHALANGADERPVIPNEPSKSVGSEETFSADLDARPEILREVLRLSERTAGRLRAKGLCGRTITLKVRFSNFKTITRSRTLPEEVDSGAEIYQVARALFEGLPVERPRIRLLGVSVAGLASGPPRTQLDLLTTPRPGWREATGAIDSIRRRFGDEAVGPATLLDR